MKHIAFAITVLLFLVGLFLTYSITSFKIKKDTQITIIHGTSLKRIANTLNQKGIINNTYLFLLLVSLSGKSVKAGTYCFKKGEGLNKIVKKLTEGNVCSTKITVIPGDNIYTIAEKLEKAGITSKRAFLKLATDPVFLLSKGVSHLSLEGFIVPQTYSFPKNSPPEYVIETFLNYFKKTYGEDSLFDSRFYKHMIIASLIEKETGSKKEYPLIASVIYNRLKRSMPLQIDATVYYISYIKGVDKNFKLLKKQTSHYNTYLFEGLPPTPICSFSKESLTAAMHPEKTKYLFYFSPDGKTHIFSKTYRQHLQRLKAYK